MSSLENLRGHFHPQAPGTLGFVGLLSGGARSPLVGHSAVPLEYTWLSECGAGGPAPVSLQMVGLYGSLPVTKLTCEDDGTPDGFPSESDPTDKNQSVQRVSFHLFFMMGFFEEGCLASRSTRETFSSQQDCETCKVGLAVGLRFRERLGG